MLIVLIVAHVIVALSSLVFAGAALLSPSTRKLQFSYAMSAMTLISGTLVVVSYKHRILQSCVTGLAYLATITAATVLAQRRLVKVNEGDQHG